MSTGWGRTLSASLAELTAALGISPPLGAEDVTVDAICDDSRDVGPGALFVAIPGAVHDGADFVGEALDRGAVAVVSEPELHPPVPHVRVEDARAALARLSAAFYGRPTEALFTVGVTGTNGKTTVCQWIAHLLGIDRTVVVGTVANEARGLRAVTTPSSRIVQRIAAEARDGGARNLVLEASSIGLAQRRLDAVDFDVGLFTNLTHDHLDLHGTMDAYLRAKRILFEGLRPTAHAVANGDDPATEAILAGCRAKPVRYGFAPGADLQGIEPVYDKRSVRCDLRWQGERAPLEVPRPGRHSLMNALGAACIGALCGLSLGEIVERLRSAPPVEGRLQFFSRGDGITAVLDFAHTPDALQRATEAVRPPVGRLFVVFGCPGESDRAKRPAMGAVAGEAADLSVVTSDNPKHEDPEAILDAIEVGLRSTGGRWERMVDRAAAIRRAVDRATAGDVILVAGKGHETYQIVGDAFLPHSDRSVLENLGFTSEP